MNYVVSIFFHGRTDVQRHNEVTLTLAMARCDKARAHTQVRKVELSVILETFSGMFREDGQRK